MNCLFFLHVFPRTLYCYGFVLASHPQTQKGVVFFIHFISVHIFFWPLSHPMHHFIHHPCNMPVGPDCSHFDVEDGGSMSPAQKTTVWNSVGMCLLGKGASVLWSQLHGWKYSSEGYSEVYWVGCFWRMLTGRFLWLQYEHVFLPYLCVCKPVVFVCQADSTIKRGKRLVLVCRQDSESGAAWATDCWVPSHLWQMSNKTEAQDHEHQCHTKPHASTCHLWESVCK